MLLVMHFIFVSKLPSSLLYLQSLNVDPAVLLTLIHVSLHHLRELVHSKRMSQYMQYIIGVSVPSYGSSAQ